MAHDDGHSWLHPGPYYDASGYFPALMEHGALLISRLLHEVGMSSVQALAAVADYWRSESMLPETQWEHLRKLNRGTIELFKSMGLPQVASDSDVQLLIERWQFPLYTLDLSLLKVDIDTLRDKQRLWAPDSY